MGFFTARLRGTMLDFLVQSLFCQSANQVIGKFVAEKQTEHVLIVNRYSWSAKLCIFKGTWSWIEVCSHFRLNFVGREKPVRGAWLLERLKRKEMPECWGKDAGRIERQDHIIFFLKGWCGLLIFQNFWKIMNSKNPGFHLKTRLFWLTLRFLGFRFVLVYISLSILNIYLIY